VNNERVGSESIIHVAGPDPKQCMVDGPGYSTAKALPMILHHDSPTNRCCLGPMPAPNVSLQTKTLAAFNITALDTQGTIMRVGGAVFSGASLLCLGEALHMVCIVLLRLSVWWPRCEASRAVGIGGGVRCCRICCAEGCEQCDSVPRYGEWVVRGRVRVRRLG
jgi:hypothetical protein